MRDKAIIFALVAVAAMAGAACVSARGQPSPTAGRIVGALQSTRPITRVVAVDRSAADPLAVSKEDPDGAGVYPGKWIAKTQAVEVEGVAAGKTYDLIVWTANERWEGVNMDYHRAVTPDEPATEEDKKWIKDFVGQEQQFANKSRVLWLAADHKHATALVELIRDTEFHSADKGEVIYRTELWYFENYFGGWAKDRNTEKVLTRWRGDGKTLPKVWQYLPALGGIEVSATGVNKELKVTLPEPDKKRGLAGGN